MTQGIAEAMLAMQAQELLDIGANVVICSSTEDIVAQAKAATGEQAIQRGCFLYGLLRICNI